MLSLVKTVKEKNEDYICPVAFNPFKKDQHSIHGIKKKYLQLHFIAGRHIFGLGRTYQSVNTSNVDYSIEIIGVDADKAKYRFKVKYFNQKIGYIRVKLIFLLKFYFSKKTRLLSTLSLLISLFNLWFSIQIWLFLN